MPTLIESILITTTWTLVILLWNYAFPLYILLLFLGIDIMILIYWVKQQGEK